MPNILLSMIVLLMAAAGCASVKPLDAHALGMSAGQRIAYTTRKPPSFSAVTLGRAATPLFLGMPAAASEGSQIISNNGIPDPTIIISNGLLRAMESKYAVHISTAPIDVDTDDLSYITPKLVGEARFVLDLQNKDWWFAPHVPLSTRYSVHIIVVARLIETKTRSVAAEGKCSFMAPRQEDFPTYDELLANNAIVLRAALSRAGNHCLDVLKAQLGL